MLTRRGFLTGLAAIAATPIVKPKKSFFFVGFDSRPRFTLREMQRALGKCTYGGTREYPNWIVASPAQWKAYWDHFEPGYRYCVGDPVFSSIAFNGNPVIVSDNKHAITYCIGNDIKTVRFDQLLQEPNGPLLEKLDA